MTVHPSHHKETQMLKEKNRLIIAFLVPACILYIVFFLWPAIQSFQYSLYYWRGFSAEKEFVGLRNFQQILSLRPTFDSQFPFIHVNPMDARFWMALRTTLLWTVVGGIITFSLTFLLTAMLSSGIRGKNFFRAVIFLPNVVASVALAVLWGFIYNPRFGMLSGFFRLLGLEDLSKIPWLAPDRAAISVLVAMCWIWVGFYLVMLLAGVDRIPRDMFDAAKVDGANQFQVFFQVTVPLIWDVLSIAVIHFTISALKVFEFPMIIMGRDPIREIWSLGMYTYIKGFGKRDPIYRLGYSSALGALTQVCVVVLIVVASRLFRRESVEF